MAEFSKLVITDNGQALLAKMIVGTGNIEFTKISTSSATYTENQLQGLTSLDDIKQTSLISKVTRTNEVAIKLEAAFTNTELTAGYYMKTLGLYAVDPDDGEILYAVTREISGNCYMPAYNGITVSGAYIQLVSTVGNAENVSLEVDQAAVATIGDIWELQKQIDNLSVNIWQEIPLTQFAEMDSYITSSSVDIRYNPALSEVKVHFKPISTGANGDVATGDVIGTVKADYKPAFTQYGTCVIKSSSDVCIRSVEINSEGKITILNDGETAAAIDNLLSLDLSYIIGTAAE